MFYTTETFEILILFLFSIFCFGNCSGQCMKKKFLLKKSFENKLITDLSLWIQPGLGSSEVCGKNCSLDEECVSFFYNAQSDVCTAHTVQFYSTEPGMADEGSRYYTLTVDKHDCADILSNNPTAPDGVYTINPFDGKGPIRVYCDMTTDGGGWTVFQRREDGTTSFERNWAKYKNGFGDLTAEFWLGNDIISRLTAARASQLRVDMLDHLGQSGVATYSQFKVGNEASKYILTVSGYSGNVGDSLTQSHNGMMFSSWDRDNDISTANCALFFKAGWWYVKCLQVNLNGIYGANTEARGIIWQSWHGTSFSLVWTEMKLRPV